jgi:hypothetical protein
MEKPTQCESHRESNHIWFNVFLYGKTHVFYIFHIKKHSVLLPDNFINTHEYNFNILRVVLTPNNVIATRTVKF